mmetsp:Transcript_63602/g.186018  ORF Transcript_63602/g.186018 Transcript_63602/m.186018 type:complete len:323 (+) Transcript_63602:1200-2168(+)
MVSDLLLRSVRSIGRMLGRHPWQQRHDFHDVVHRGQGQHGPDPLPLDREGAVRAPPQEPRVHQQLLEALPGAEFVELQTLLALAHLRPRLLNQGQPHRRRGPHHPQVVHAVAEAVLAVQVRAHEPVEGKEGTDGPLVLVVQPPRGKLGLNLLWLLQLRQGRQKQVQAKLREGSAAVVEEVPQAVVLVAHPPHCSSQRVGVQLLAGDHGGEVCVRRLPALARFGLCWKGRRERHPLDQLLGLPRGRALEAQDRLRQRPGPRPPDLAGPPGPGPVLALPQPLLVEDRRHHPGRLLPGPDLGPSPRARHALLVLCGCEKPDVRQS